MKSIAVLLFVAACTSLSLSVQLPAQTRPAAQQDPAANNAANQSNANAIPVPSTADAPEVTNPQLRPVPGELETKLDTRTTRPGESVVVRTTASAATANGIVIPKGSKIVGHVTSVQTLNQANENTRVTLQFDRAVLRGGQQLPIKSVIQSVAPAMPASSAPAAKGEPDKPEPSAQPQSASADTAPHANSALVVGKIVAKNGNLDIRTTAIPGVLLAADADGQPFPDASGALVGSQKNLHLEGGTRMVLAVAEVPLRNAR